MKSKLVGVCVSFLVCATWWTGCSSSVANTTNDGGAAEAGGPLAEAGNDPVEAGTDAPVDTGVVDSALSGPFVAITYGSCAAFTPCGGDPTGTFNVSGGCVGNAAFAEAKATCPGIVESNVVFEARGTVTADATTIKRNTEVKLAASLFVPAVCVSQVGTCADLEGALVLLAKLDTATCTTDGAGGCDCAVTDKTAEKTEDTYTKSATTITTAGPPTRTFDYCVTGNEIKYLETTANSVPATFVLTK